MAEDSTRSLYFPSLVGGVRSSAPPRTLSPDGQYIWRDSLNMLSRDGVTIGRPGIAALFHSSVGQPPAPPTITGVDTSEVPRYLNLSSSFILGGPRITLITTRQAYVYGFFGWKNVTPTYSTGTISLTNGSGSGTGAGTAFQDRGIDVAYLLIDGTTYLFTTTGNTTFTITPNYAGATGAGKAYVIRRRFSIGLDPIGFREDTNAVFAVPYFSDLYIAGTCLASGTVTPTAAPAVIKVTSAYDASSPTTSYLTGAAAYDAGTDFISGLSRIAGLTALQDGRLVFPGNQNEVFYSSHLNDAVWTVSPAGDTPLAEIDSKITAQGRIGSVLTFHHHNGIIHADPTGLDDPPLRFQASPATMGTVAPLTLKRYLGGEAFMAGDGDVKHFDGNTVRSIGDHEMTVRTRGLASFSASDYGRYFAWVSGGRDEYNLARHEGSSVKFWTYQPGGDVWWLCETSIAFGAVSDDAEAANATDSPASNATTAAVGCPSTASAVLQVWKEGAADSSGSPTYMLETDDLDGGMPLQLKTPQRAAVWPVATMDDLTVSVRRADDTTYVAMTADPLATNRPKWFDFQPGQVSGAVGADNAHRWKLSGTTLRLGVFALLLRWVVGGEKEKVTTG